MSNKFIKAFWGDLQGDELKKFILLAAGFFFIIGSYWPMRTLKDSFFINMVGPTWQPYVKMISLAIFFPVVLIYAKLVDMFSKRNLIYVVLGFYGVLGLVFVALLNHPTIGLQNQVTSPYRLVGWFFYVYAETYISLIMSLYWSYASDITSPESAKKGYGLIIFGTQLGGVLLMFLGNVLSADTAQYAHRAPLILFISICMFLGIALMTFLLQSLISKKNLESYSDSKGSGAPKILKNVGFIEGLKTILVHPYVIGVFGLIFFHELISTVMNYQMLLLISKTFSNGGLVNKFLFEYNFCVQLIACLFGLFGTSFFQRRFGIKFCIVTYPLLLGGSIVSYLFYPTLGTIFYVMLIAKAINYAFNQPAKEVLYIPTSRDIKYKSKAWVDMFGARLAKATGSAFDATFSGILIGLPSVIIMSCIGCWVLVANLLGNRFQKAIKNNEIIE